MVLAGQTPGDHGRPPGRPRPQGGRPRQRHDRHRRRRRPHQGRPRRRPSPRSSGPPPPAPRAPDRSRSPRRRRPLPCPARPRVRARTRTARTSPSPKRGPPPDRPRWLRRLALLGSGAHRLRRWRVCRVRLVPAPVLRGCPPGQCRHLPRGFAGPRTGQAVPRRDRSPTSSWPTSPTSSASRCSRPSPRTRWPTRRPCSTAAHRRTAVRGEPGHRRRL